MSDISPEELDDLKDELKSKINVLKDSAQSDEDLEKIDKFIHFLAVRDAESDDDEKKVEDLKKINAGLSYFQRFKQSFEKDMDIDPGRLLGLTDGIFGMVMTLLIFGIAIPDMLIGNYSDFISFISELLPTIGVTVVSFILLSSFWIYHHEFIKINNLNIPYLWINIFFLICISFIPFTTSLIGSYSYFFLSNVVFGINIMLTIASFLLMYYYANNRGFLENKPSSFERKYVYKTFGIIMGLTIVVNLLDFNVNPNFIYLFLLVPVISTLRDINFRMTDSH